VIRILRGDCREVLRTLGDASVQCVVTSPPYFGLRDYKASGQIGLEASPSEYVVALREVFWEVRRVLREDGTVWLNLGDSYACDAGKGQHKPGDPGKHNYIIERGNGRAAGGMALGGVIKEKDLLMIPARVALALQADGWWLRSDIIWHKPNPMPESVTDRPTAAHEHVFLLTKAARYFYDGDAVREGYNEASVGRYNYAMMGTGPASRQPGGDMKRAAREKYQRGPNPAGRNLRNVWTITTRSFTDAHFATFPPDLADRCIKAGTSERGACPTCGAPWVRIVTKGAPDEAHKAACGADALGCYNGRSTKDHAAAGVQDASAVKARILAGMRERISEWHQSCACSPAHPVPCVVLDPFYGAGTTGLVADRLGRDCIGIELNPDYTVMAANRLTRDAGLFAEVAHE